MRTRTAATLLGLVLLGTLAACGDDAPAPRQAIGSVRPTTPASEPEFGKPGRPVDGGQGKGNGLGVTDVRLARHNGFDRIVIDLGGKGTPGWNVRYVKRAVADGSGERIALKGDSILAVTVHGVGYPVDTGVEEFGDIRTRVSGSGTESIAEVAPGVVFEGSQVAYVGLEGSKRPFRVFALTSPTRLVVDVRQP